ncbi:hypothetical protein EYF80_029715 [Liparis tanakae]|uniref:Uncharacterized protein n=1 Tax=Liparis tanakae TaxID=230148 RepID=A0A4Z2H2M7_9TELE|nr:hypothetical protein EYF80_029715 [Liparis tanakae]
MRITLPVVTTASLVNTIGNEGKPAWAENVKRNKTNISNNNNNNNNNHGERGKQQEKHPPHKKLLLFTDN